MFEAITRGVVTQNPDSNSFLQPIHPMGIERIRLLLNSTLDAFDEYAQFEIPTDPDHHQFKLMNDDEGVALLVLKKVKELGLTMVYHSHDKDLGPRLITVELSLRTRRFLPDFALARSERREHSEVPEEVYGPLSYAKSLSHVTENRDFVLGRLSTISVNAETIS